MINIYIIIPVFNRKNTTDKCLEKLSQQDYKDFNIIVIDDGSTDGTSDLILSKYPKVKLILGDGNLWWTGAINKGLELIINSISEHDYILILNDDLLVPCNYISTLFSLIDKFPNSIIGSVIISNQDNQTIIDGGVRINWKTAKREKINKGKKIFTFPYGYYEYVSVLTGRGVLIPSTVFKNLGLYNNKHYPHYGDTELTIRAKKAGYHLIMSYDAIVYSEPLKENSICVNGYYKLTDIKDYFFNIRSNTNLRDRFWFAFDNSPNILWGIRYFLFDLIRITYHFIVRIKFLKN